MINIQRTYVIILTVIALIITSCEKELAYNGDDLNNFIVVNSLAQSDSILTCSITRSKTIFEQGVRIALSDATAELYLNDQPLGLAIEREIGIYSWENIKIKEGQTYSLQVSHKSYNDVKTEISIPSKSNAQISAIRKKMNTNDYSYYYDYDQYNEEYIETYYDKEIDLTINDSDGEDFYRLAIYMPEMSYLYDEEDYSKEPILYTDFSKPTPTDFICDDPILNNNKVKTDEEFTSDVPNYFNVINDDLFNGKSYTFTVRMFATETKDENIPYTIDVQKISKEMYLYLQSIAAQDYLGEDPFSEPVRLYSNIKGGAGILGAVTSNIITTANIEITIEE